MSNLKHIREMKKEIKKMRRVKKVKTEYGKRHIRAVIELVNGNIAVATWPHSPGGSNRSVSNALADTKREIRKVS